MLSGSQGRANVCRGERILLEGEKGVVVKLEKNYPWELAARLGQGNCGIPCVFSSIFPFPALGFLIFICHFQSIVIITQIISTHLGFVDYCVSI